MTTPEYLASVGVPKQFCKHTRETFKSKISPLLEGTLVKAYEKAYSNTMKIIDDQEYGLFITGPSGSGKTSLAVSALAHVRDNGSSVAMTSVYEITEFYFDGFQGIRPRYIEADYLLIDAVDKKLEIKNNHATSILQSIIHKRDELKKVTIFTATEDRSCLASLYNQSILDIITNNTIKITLSQMNLKVMMMQEYAKGL